MALKKNEVPKIYRPNKRPRIAYSHKRTLKKLRMGSLKRMRYEMREVKAETSSVRESQEKILTELDDLKSEVEHSREVNKHVILHNTRTHQLLDVMFAQILIGSGSAPEQGASRF